MQQDHMAFKLQKRNCVLAAKTEPWSKVGVKHWKWPGLIAQAGSLATLTHSANLPGSAVERTALIQPGSGPSAAMIISEAGGQRLGYAHPPQTGMSSHQAPK